jgi:hypothetical protein
MIAHKHFTMGTAPYTYTGLWTAPSNSLAEVNPQAYNNAWADAPSCCRSCCDHCGTGIANHCIIKDSTGKLFAIGADCLGKLDDVENLTQAEADRKAHQRSLSRARAEVKAQAKWSARETALQAQRDINNGLTDWELAEKKRQDARDLAGQKFDYFVAALKATGGDFARSIASGLLNGNAPRGRGLDILLEITAKHYSGSRAGSKAYNAALDVACDKWDAITN